MFYCERCETHFNAGAASSASSCPRCRSKDGVDSPLCFQIFDPAARRLAAIDPTRDLQSEEREPAEDRSPESAPHP
jgi:hypothetical protein